VLVLILVGVAVLVALTYRNSTEDSFLVQPDVRMSGRSADHLSEVDHVGRNQASMVRHGA
jgi:hypothetical protein